MVVCGGCCVSEGVVFCDVGGVIVVCMRGGTVVCIRVICYASEGGVVVCMCE
jgi:hypothetical protein